MSVPMNRKISQATVRVAVTWIGDRRGMTTLQASRFPGNGYEVTFKQLIPQLSVTESFSSQQHYWVQGIKYESDVKNDGVHTYKQSLY